MKVLYFDRGGYCIWSKRLEQGRFHYRGSADDKVSLDVTGLKLILEGISVGNIRRHKRYRHSTEPRMTMERGADVIIQRHVAGRFRSP